MQNIKISIIVPIYNVEKYLVRCLDSLVNQTMKDIEIILVNDASPDNSDIIMKEYESKFPDKVKTIYHKDNQGLGGARNTGLKQAIGEYVLFIDSDDYVDITMCEKLYLKAISMDYDVVCCEYLEIGKKRNVIDLFMNQVMGDLNQEKRNILMSVLSVGAVAKIIKREILIEHEIFFPEKVKYEDLSIIPLLWEYVDRMEQVEEPLYIYERHEDSTTMLVNSVSHYEILKAAKYVEEEIKRRGLKQKYQKEIEGIFIRAFLDEIKICKNRKAKPVIEELRLMHKLVLQYIPNWENNPLTYKRNDPDIINLGKRFMKDKTIFDNGFDVEILTEEEKHYSDYYKMVKGKTDGLIQYCVDKGYHIALWGAGKKGQDFLFVNDRKKEHIKYIIDKNPKKWGEVLETGHKVVSFEDVKQEVDLMLVANRVYFGGIKRQIKKIRPEIAVLNLDAYYLLGDNHQIEEFLE